MTTFRSDSYAHHERCQHMLAPLFFSPSTDNIMSNTNIIDKIKHIVRDIDAEQRFKAEHKAVLRLLWVNWGNHFTQRDIAKHENWMGCHPEHEADILHSRFDTTTRQVRQVIRDLRVHFKIPILSDRAGYYLPSTQEECDKWMKDMESQARSRAAASIETYKAMREATNFQSQFLDQLELAVTP